MVEQPGIWEMQEAVNTSSELRPSTRALLGEDASWEKLLEEAARHNQEGMAHLRRAERTEAFEQLTIAQELVSWGDGVCPSQEDRKSLSAVWADTISNMGIYHKRGQNYAAAIRCLQKGLKLYKTACADVRALLAANLNISACYLEADTPDAALRHATAAVELAGQLVVALDQDGGGSAARADDYAMLAVAYHKVAEAHEGLRDWGAASFAYTQAYEVVKRSLGPKHRLTRSFEKSSRCPHKPELPDSAFSNATSGGTLSFYGGGKRPASSPGMGGALGRTPRQLPTIPVGMTQRRIGAGIDLTGYKLNASHFAAWPPEGVAHDEAAWYAMAQHHRGAKKAQVAALVQGSSGSAEPRPVSRAGVGSVGHNIIGGTPLPPKRVGTVVDASRR